jgi:uncharacterized protein (TIGR02569 family)
MRPLPGGTGRAWLVGDAVVKPLDMTPAALAWQAGVLAALDGRDDVRVTVPLRTASGALVVDGWTAWRYEPGRHVAGRWLEIVDVGRRLHAGLRDVSRPAFLATRDDPWAVADRVAWGEAPRSRFLRVEPVRVLAAALRPLAGRRQLIHGDLTGNVLFADGRPPLVIDLSPYWRPPAYASAIVAADALAFEGARPDQLAPLLAGPEAVQYLLRALLFRAVTDLVAAPGAADRVGRYTSAVDLAVRLARAP